MRTSRILLIEIVVGASVVVISVASLFVAVYQSIVMQRTLEASVWPVIEFDHGNLDDETGAAAISFEISNDGLGPGEIVWMEILYRGEPIANASDLLAKCCVAEEGGTIQERRDALFDLFDRQAITVVTDNHAGSVLSPGEQLRVLYIPRPDPETSREAATLWSLLNRERWEMRVRICYCSVFEDCTLASFPDAARERVRRCEPAPDIAFGQRARD